MSSRSKPKASSSHRSLSSAIAHPTFHDFAEKIAQLRAGSTLRQDLARAGCGARRSAAVGVAHANRHAKEAAQGLQRGALSGGAYKRKKSPTPHLTKERLAQLAASGKKLGKCQCGKEGPLKGQHNVRVGGAVKFCGKYK